MHVRKLIVASLIAAGAAAAPGLSQARTYVDIDVAPPADRVEGVPAPRRGYVWAPGYWDYNGRKHVWAKGHWIKQRHGYHWAGDKWEQRDGKWHRDRGHWDHD